MLIVADLVLSETFSYFDFICIYNLSVYCQVTRLQLFYHLFFNFVDQLCRQETYERVL